MKWEELEAELLAIPGFNEAYDLEYPYEDVATEIAAVRGRRDMTQTEFGALVGIPQSTVARLESGKQNPSVGMLKRIARATGTDLVIEFRHKARPRRGARPRRSDEPAATPPTEISRVAASGRPG